MLAQARAEHVVVVGHAFRTEYDALRRPVQSFVRGAISQDLNEEILYARTVYGEGQTNDQRLNLRGRLFRRCDGAGVVTSLRFDHQGNLLSGTRQLLQNYKDADPRVTHTKARSGLTAGTRASRRRDCCGCV